MKHATNHANPFITGQAVRDTDFIGRKSELAEVSEFLQTPNSVHLIITGQRRCGKTSFLKKIQNTFQSQERNILYFNLQDKADVSLNRVVEFIRARTERHLNFDHPFYEKQSFGEYLEAALEHTQTQLVWLFDEFDVMCPDATEVARKTLEARMAFCDYLNHIQLHRPSITRWLKIIYAIGTNYAESVSHTCGRMVKSAQRIRLATLSDEEIDGILNMSKPLEFCAEAKARLSKLSGGNPYFLQILAADAYEHAESRSKQSIELQDVDLIISETIARFEVGFDSIMDGFKTTEKKVLKTIAELETNATFEQILEKSKLEDEVLEKSLKTLIHNDFIKKNRQKGYTFSAEILKHSLRKHN